MAMPRASVSHRITRCSAIARGDGAARPIPCVRRRAHEAVRRGHRPRLHGRRAPRRLLRAEVEIPEQ
ncbi:hypothetical protein ACX84U_22620, partial [Burkholderia pseudomallei]